MTGLRGLVHDPATCELCDPGYDMAALAELEADK